MWLIFDVIRKSTDTSDVQTKSIYADIMRIIIIIINKNIICYRSVSGELFRTKARIRSHAGWPGVFRGV